MPLARLSLAAIAASGLSMTLGVPAHAQYADDPPTAYAPPPAYYPPAPPA